MRTGARRPLRHPALALPVVVGLGLLAAFFAWQSAEPLWLAVGHGVPGTAEVTVCDAAERPADRAGADLDGAVDEPAGAVGPPAGAADAPADPTVPYPCVVFTAEHNGFRAVDVTLLGAGDAAERPGTRIPARMTGPDRDRAYAADPTGLHLRWSLGMLLVLASGAGIAWASGATRLTERPARWRAVGLSFAGPLVITAGFLVAAL